MIFLIIWFILIVISEALALYCVKYYSLHNDQWQYLMYSFGLYGIIVYGLSKLLELGEGIAIINISWNIVSTLYGLFIGIALFGEKITNLQLIGTFLGVVGVSLILADSKN